MAIGRGEHRQRLSHETRATLARSYVILKRMYQRSLVRLAGKTIDRMVFVVGKMQYQSTLQHLIGDD